MAATLGGAPITVEECWPRGTERLRPEWGSPQPPPSPLASPDPSPRTGEKPFECKLCHQRSRDYSAMIKHLRTHNGASPYQCTICSEYCPSLSSMQTDSPPEGMLEDLQSLWGVFRQFPLSIKSPFPSSSMLSRCVTTWAPLCTR